VDETSFQKRHEYVTVVCDQQEGIVVHVADGRGRDSLDDFYKAFDEEERKAVESVSMDMWPAYIGSTEQYIPDAETKIAFDKFHVAQYLSKAVDKIRRKENKILISQGDECLKGSKYLWLQNPDNMSDERWASFEELREGSLKTAKAWAIKELAMSLWYYVYRGNARKAWNKWYSWRSVPSSNPSRRSPE
jgi:transposase